MTPQAFAGALGPIFQVGFVVPDLDAAQSYFIENLGTGPFLTLRRPEIEDRVFRGEPTPDAAEDTGFAFRGDLQVEVIQPLEGRSTYAEFLEQNPGGGLHHLGIKVDDFDRGVEEFGGNDQAVQSGRAGGMRFAYFDAAPLGALLEVLYLDPDTQKMMDDFRAESAS